MSEVLQTNIFFFITSISVVAVTLVLLVVLYYVITILREARKITENLRRASDNFERDLDYLRTEARQSGMKVMSLFNLLINFVMGSLTRQRRTAARRRPSRNSEETTDSV